jgi:hypothetical protein
MGLKRLKPWLGAPEKTNRQGLTVAVIAGLVVLALGYVARLVLDLANITPFRASIPIWVAAVAVAVVAGAVGSLVVVGSTPSRQRPSLSTSATRWPTFDGRRRASYRTSRERTSSSPASFIRQSVYLRGTAISARFGSRSFIRTKLAIAS